MALYIKSDGTYEEIEIPRQESLKFLQEKVGGYIEIVYPAVPNADYEGLVVNEEGRLLGLPVNVMAAALFGPILTGDVIAFKPGEVD